MESFRYKRPWTISCVVVLIAQVVSFGEDLSNAESDAYFEKHVRPLLVSRCYSCHSSRSKNSEGGLVLDSRAGWQAGGESGSAIVPGDVNASLLIRAVRYSDSDLQMPPDGVLPKNSIKRLERWVELGAPDPRVRSNADASTHVDAADPIAGRAHWAFRPLAELQRPEVVATEWPRDAIDTFVLARLEKASLTPAPDADQRTLVRRVYVQLIGLPPTPEQLSEFLSDDRSDPLAHLVDELLESPQFGERWGRHWMDLARYADSNGLDENFLFREAWRYRNRVIASFNSDIPFDRFLDEQIAGDLLPYDSIQQRDQQRIAAGFLVVGPKVLLGNDPVERRMDVADEQLDTIGRAILGQTLGCARCHDHKFDAVPTADYYALAGIFTSTQVMENRYMLGQQRLMERLVGLGPSGDVADSKYEAYWRERPKFQERHTHAKAALDLLKKEDAKAFQTHAEKHANAIADGANDPSLSSDQRFAAQQTLIDQLAKLIAEQPKIPMRAMIPSDEEAPSDEHIRIAGQFDRLGEKVPRGFLRALNSQNVQISAGASGRRELANWLTDTDDGAGHLAARVLANRVWHHLIGSGIVRTVDNFGRTGEAPSHPELLDHLAHELIDSGWSLKSLIRRIVLSRTFAMGSHHDDAGHAIDPDNRLLWRAHRRRLDPETLRDAMLLAAGTLELRPMESSVWYLGDQATAVGDNKNRRRTNFPHRSVYLPVIRNDLPALFDVFDFADPHATTGMRPKTMVATQGLFILNDESVMAASEATARRLLTGEIDIHSADNPQLQERRLTAATAVDHRRGRVDRMFELILNARASAEERREILRFVDQTKKLSAEDNEADLRVWSMACQALFASSRFQILE